MFFLPCNLKSRMSTKTGNGINSSYMRETMLSLAWLFFLLRNQNNQIKFKQQPALPARLKVSIALPHD